MVLADGCFDPLHIGHIRYLQSAQEMAGASEMLEVRVAPDSAIRAKGREPFQAEPERVLTINQIAKCIVVSGDSLEHTIRTLRPRLLVKGMDWMGRLPAEVLAACADVGTSIVFTQTPSKTSTERLK